VLWAETGTLPYLARKHGPREVNVTVRAVRLPTGVYPAEQSRQALDVIQRAWPSVLPCGDALSGALMNAGPIIHPPLIVMNAAPLQHFERWDIHTEGTQPSVRAVTDGLDAERIAIREALGYSAPHFPLADHYRNDQWMYGDAHKKLQKSGDWREHIDLSTHRYVTEDTELGLALLASLARWAEVDAPLAHGLLAITGGFLGRDLRRGPRTLESLGLWDLDRAHLQAMLHTGEDL
jgi:opine dehydrogenase